MKTLTLLSIVFICGCGNPYPKEKELVLIQVGGNGSVDSITLIKDTLRVYKHSDSFALTFDSTYILKVGGDMLTGRAVKNEYNNKK